MIVPSKGIGQYGGISVRGFATLEEGWELERLANIQAEQIGCPLPLSDSAPSSEIDVMLCAADWEKETHCTPICPSEDVCFADGHQGHRAKNSVVDMVSQSVAFSLGFRICHPFFLCVYFSEASNLFQRVFFFRSCCR